MLYRLLEGVHVPFFILLKARPWLVEMGARPLKGGPGEGFQGCQWRFASGTLELLEPRGMNDNQSLFCAFHFFPRFNNTALKFVQGHPKNPSSRDFCSPVVQAYIT